MSPVSPTVIQTKIQKNRGPEIDKFCASIDEALNKLDCLQPADSHGSYSEVVVGNCIHEGEKEVIVKAYKDVGWKHVTIRFSEETGERAGLARVRLYYDYTIPRGC